MLFSGHPQTPLRSQTKAKSQGDLLLDFASHQRMRSYRARDVVLAQSEGTSHVFIVIRGWVGKTVQRANGRTQIMSIAMPGDLCCGELRTQQHMDHAIAAITPITIAIVSKFDFRTVLSHRPQLTRAFWKNQQQTLSRQLSWSAMLGLSGAIERIAYLMCELYCRQKNAAAGPDTDSCPFPLTQTQVAQACGLTQVHTNRTIQEMRRRGLIELANRQLTITSLAQLMAVANFHNRSAA